MKRFILITAVIIAIMVTSGILITSEKNVQAQEMHLVSVNDAVVIETIYGFEIEINISPPTIDTDFWVYYEITEGSAKEHADYLVSDTSGEVFIPSGVSYAGLPVFILDDDEIEGFPQVYLPSGVSIADVSLTVYDTEDTGEVEIFFRRDGWVTPHLVHIASDEGDKIYTLEVVPLTGQVKLYTDNVDWQDLM